MDRLAVQGNEFSRTLYASGSGAKGLVGARRQQKNRELTFEHVGELVDDVGDRREVGRAGKQVQERQNGQLHTDSTSTTHLSMNVTTRFPLSISSPIVGHSLSASVALSGEYEIWSSPELSNDRENSVALI